MDISNLNEQQKQVVLHKEGPLAVLAAAGSGKTRVLTNRVGYLIESGVSPYGIYCCTFTTKAASTMKDRIVESFGDDADGVNTSTLHGLCYKILKKIYRKTKPGQEIRVAKSPSLWLFLGKKIKDDKHYVKDIKSVFNFISNQKLNCIGVDQLREQIRDLIDEPTLDHTKNEDLSYYYLYKEYQKFLKKNNWVDFADMLYETYTYLADPKNKDFTDKITNKIDYLLVDEFQDANLISYNLYKILGSQYNNIMVVGDPRQSIYSFQGSSYQFLFDFVKDYNSKEIELPLNYRSTKTIIDHSNLLIQKDPVFADKEAITLKPAGPPVEVVYSVNECDEASRVLELIDQIRIDDEGVNLKDIAILYRVNAQSAPIVDKFTMHEIPFTIKRKGSFYARREIRQLVAYVKILSNPFSGTYTDFKLIANAPTRYIKTSTLETIDDFNETNYFDTLKSIHEFEKNYQQIRAIGSLVSDIETARKRLDGKSTTAILHHVLHDMGYLKWLQKDGRNDDMEGADEDTSLNTEVLYSASEAFPNPEDFISYAESMQEKDLEKDDDFDGVRLMTMHASKGLEFKYVILIGVCARLTPYYRSHGDRERLQEERRIMYVGVTRAEEKLYISTLMERFGRFKTYPSEYLQEMNLRAEPNRTNRW